MFPAREVFLCQSSCPVSRQEVFPRPATILSNIGEGSLRLVAETFERAEAYPCDVSQPQAVEHLVRSIHESYGPLDILVNNAAICPRNLANAVAPGAINTRMFTGIGEDEVSSYVKCVPLGRQAEPRGSGAGDT